jgi:hypothetical protein
MKNTITVNGLESFTAICIKLTMEGATYTAEWNEIHEEGTITITGA